MSRPPVDEAPGPTSVGVEEMQKDNDEKDKDDEDDGDKNDAEDDEGDKGNEIKDEGDNEDEDMVFPSTRKRRRKDL